MMGLEVGWVGEGQVGTDLALPLFSLKQSLQTSGVLQQLL